jgi:CheY-like chemotaxis protein
MSVPQSAGRILVMDDEPLILQMTCEMLELSGFQALAFTQGEQIVDFLKAEGEQNRQVDLVLMDLNIPKGMGGLEAVKRIRAFNETVPIVLTSGYSSDDALMRPEAYGVSGGLKKPFRRAELLAAVQRWKLSAAPLS